jgi:RNA polymerase sigma-70 factor (ECF subfamily)
VPAGDLDLDVNNLVDDLPERSVVDEEALQAALNELADEFKTVLLMFYFQGYSYKQIAAELELPIGTVMSRLSRGKRHLRHRLFGPVTATAERPVAGIRPSNADLH